MVPHADVDQTAQARSIRGLAEGLVGGRSDGQHEKVMASFEMICLVILPTILLVATSLLGQNHIFCLLNVLGNKKTVGQTAAVLQRYRSSGNAMRIESLPPLPLWLSAGGCASISVKPVIHGRVPSRV